MTNQVWESWRDDRLANLTQQRDELLATLSLLIRTANDTLRHPTEVQLSCLDDCIKQSNAVIDKAEGKAR